MVCGLVTQEVKRVMQGTRIHILFNNAGGSGFPQNLFHLPAL